MAKILLTGARGLLGRRLAESLAPGNELCATARTAEGGLRALDVTDEETVRAAVRETRPDWIVNAAAYTAVDRAESEPEAARRGNVEAPGFLARAAAEVGAELCHVSTDFVFGGDGPGAPWPETAAVAPRGVYAETKAAGEARVREILPDAHLIVRVAWSFGPDAGNFVATMLRLGREKERLKVVDDQRGSPTFTRDAAAVTARLLDSEVRGTVHAAGQGEATWCALARETLRLAGIETPVDPIATADWPTPAPRPRDSRLANRVLAETVGDSMRPWPVALLSYLEELGALAGGR